LLPPPARGVLVGAPSASGFWGAGGLRGLVPKMYASLEQAFWREVVARRSSLQIFHYDHRRGGGQTFHAKGLWLWPHTTDAPANYGTHAATSPSAADPLPLAPEAPFATFVGSSNFGERSVRRDVEISAWLLTTDAALRSRLARERDDLIDGAHAVHDQTYTTPEHAVGVAARILRHALRAWC